MIGGVAIIASIIGTFAVRTNSDNVERALLQGLAVSGVIAAAAFAPITYWLMRSLTFKDVGSAVNTPKWWHLYLCSLIGIAVTALLFGITEYYTSTRFSPVKKTAKASITGHATNIIQGFSSGLQATALPAIVIVLGILGAWKLAGGGVTGIYGIGVAAMGLLSLTGLIVALDAFGPITDNAGGIAEMADLPEEVRKVTDRLDAVGNTTKAVTKGYAIGSAVLAAIVLFAGFQKELEAQGRARDLLRHQRTARADRPAARRPDGVPVRLALDRGRRPRRRRGRRGGAPPVPRAPGDHGLHRRARLRARAWTSSRRPRSAR